MARTTPFLRLLHAGSLVALATLSCGREPTVPGTGGVVRSQGIAFATEFPSALPAFQAAGGTGVAFTKVRIVLNNLDGTVALDTVVAFPAGATELPVTLTVPLPATAPATGVPLALSLKYVNAAGDTVFKGGPVTVVAVPKTAGAGPPPPSTVTIPITYTGPGANATAVHISPKALTVNTKATFNFSAQALDAGGAVIPNTPVVFIVVDPTKATINAATGAGTAGSARGSVQVVAQLLTGSTDAATLMIVSPPAALALMSGGGQTANVNATLANPVVVKVTATDGGPAQGVTVAFAAQGGSVGSASATTDADGLAQTTWQLGPAGGTQALTASATGLTGSPVTVSATARALDAVRLVVASQPPASTAAGTAFGLVVNAVDATGTVTPAFTGPVTVVLGAGAPPGASLTGTTTVTAVAGVATFTDLKLNVPGTYTLATSAPSLAGASTSSFQIAAGVAAKLAFQSYPIIGAVAGATFDAVTVVAKDSLGNPVTTYTGAVTLTAMAPAAAAQADNARAAVPAPGAATTTSPGATPAGVQPANALTGTTTVNALAGVATFPGLAQTTAGVWALSASASGLTGVTGPPFTITPAAATALSLAGGAGQSGPGGAPLANPIVVKVADGFGNAVGGVTVTFTPAGGSGTVSPTTAVSTAGTGLAQTSWTLAGASGAKTLNITGPGLSPSPLAVTATATTATSTAAKLLTFTAQPSNVVAGAAITPALVVTAKDSLGGTAMTFTGNVTLVIGTNPGGATLSGTATVAAVAGVATFGTIALNKAGTGYTLTASAAAVTGATSATFNVTNGPAATIALSSGNTQLAAVSAKLAAPLAVLVTDAFGNPASGVSVTWATGSGGTLAPAGTTNASGIATASWTLGATTGAQAATASAGGLTGSPVTFSATAIPASTTRTWIGGNGAGPTNWSVAANWSPAVLPGASDNVYIPPVGAPIQPVLTAGGVSVASLTIDPASTLGVASYGITVGGTLDARGAVNGPAGVTMNGSGVSFVGSVSALTVNGTVTLGGTAAIGGATAVTGQLTISGQALTTGTLAVNGVGAHLLMNNASDHVTVTGTAQFAGADANGWLTAGTMEVKGNFTQQSTVSTQSYFSTGSHTTVLSGTGTQAVSFQSAGPGVGNTSFFNHLSITTASTVTSAGTLFVGGTFSSAPGSSLAGVAAIQMYGSGVPFPAIGGSTSPSFIIAGYAILGGSVTYPGTLAIAGRVDVGANQLTVNGDLLVTGAGAHLYMASASSYVLVLGNATFGGADANSWLVAGTLELRGNFTQQSTFSTQAFFATGSHTTVFAGSGTQAITMDSPGPGVGATSFFNNLTVATAVAVTDATTLYVGAALGTVAGSNLAGVANVVLFGAGVAFPAVAGTPPGLLTISNYAVVTAPRTYTGAVAVNGRLDIGAQTLSVSGDFAVVGAGAHLYMNNAAGHLTVGGNATFNGADHNSWLTAGTLELQGNFAQQATYSTQSFWANPPHVTLFSGSSVQTVAMASPGPVVGATSHLGNVVSQNSSGGLSLTTKVHVSGTFTTLTATGVSSPDTLAVAGNVVTASGSALSVAVLNVWGTANFPVFGGTQPSVLLVSGTASLVSPQSYAGPLTITGRLDVNAQALTVDSLLVAGASAHLYMNNAASHVTVNRGAVFNGGDANSWLSLGTLELKRSFTQLATYSTQSFFSTGSHSTILTGTGTQTISFATPGPGVGGTSFFNNLGVNTVATVTSVGPVYVGGSFASATGSSLSGVSALVMFGSLVPFPSIGGTAPPSFTLSGYAILGSTLTYPGTLTLTGRLDVGANQLTVANDLAVTGSAAHLYFNNAASYVLVQGNATFNGADQNSWMAAGTLELKGNFTQGATSSSQSFFATGSHTTLFTGTAQTIGFATPGAGVGATSFFNNLAVPGSTAITSATTVYVGNTFTTGVSSNLAGVAGVVMFGAAPVAFPSVAGTPPAAMTITGYAIATGPANYPAALTLTGRFDLGAQTITIGGNFTVVGGGAHLYMANAAGHLTVTGNTLFNGADHNSWLTAGTLEVKGNFTQLATSSGQSFWASPGHTTQFSGTALQAINFVSPGQSVAGTSHLGSMGNTNSSGSVTVASNVYLSGGLAQSGVLTVTSPFTLGIAGALTLNPGSTTSVTGTLTRGSCSILGGTFSGFICP